jgi:hypothetical protein
MKTCFADLIGRLGNLLFIYAYARAYCEQNGYELCLPPWIGEKVFNIPEANRTPADKCDLELPEDTYQRQESLIYTRRQVREWFTFKPEILDRLKQLGGGYGIFNRRFGNDYRGFVIVSLGSYFDAAVKFGFREQMFSFEVESDEAPTRLDTFDGDMNSSGLCTSWVAIPSFYHLMTTSVLFRANSTFSWWAATLSDGRVFSPIIKGKSAGEQDCEFVEGNWPVMVDIPPNTDLHLPP